MDDAEDDAEYSSKSYASRRKNNSQFRRSLPVSHDYDYAWAEDDEDEGFDEVNDNVRDDTQDGNNSPDPSFPRFEERDRLEWYPKRQRTRTSVSGYPDSMKSAYDWTEHEVYVLLEAWGDRFLQLGRRSLRGEDWVDVAEQISDVLKNEKTETQCRRMINDLKIKFKREKQKVESTGSNSSKWAFFRKMEMLMGLSSSFRQKDSGLACGVDSGEFVFMNTQAYLDRSNGFDEMRDSPGDSEAEDEDGEEENRGLKRRDGTHDSAIRTLVDSVQRFGRIYEKIENSKKEHMRELENMRTEFQTELDLQKRQLLERAQMEVEKMNEEESEDDGDGETSEDDGSDQDEDSVENCTE